MLSTAVSGARCGAQQQQTCLTVIVMRVCARDEVAFIWVAATVREAVPASISRLMASYEPTAFSLLPSTYVPLGVVRTCGPQGIGRHHAADTERAQSNLSARVVDGSRVGAAESLQSVR